MLVATGIRPFVNVTKRTRVVTRRREDSSFYIARISSNYIRKTRSILILSSGEVDNFIIR